MKFPKSFLALLIAMSVFLFSCGQKDSDIQAKVTEKLAAQPDLTGVTSTVTDGVVTLNGEVMQEASRTEAETTVKDVKGVKSVINNTTVSAPPPPPVAAPAMAADSTLVHGVADATKDFPTVTATVENGQITLTGSIKEDKLDQLMQSLNTLNAAKINNQLTIEK